MIYVLHQLKLPHWEFRMKLLIPVTYIEDPIHKHEGYQHKVACLYWSYDKEWCSLVEHTWTSICCLRKLETCIVYKIGEILVPQNYSPKSFPSKLMYCIDLLSNGSWYSSLRWHGKKSRALLMCISSSAWILNYY